MSVKQMSLLLDFRDQINWPDFLALRFDNSILRSLRVASVVVSKIKFEGRQARVWKAQHGSHDCSAVWMIFVTTQVDKEESALSSSGCISPTHAFYLRQKSCPAVIH